MTTLATPKQAQDAPQTATDQAPTQGSQPATSSASADAADGAARIATAQMAAAITTQRMLDPAAQAQVVQQSLPALDATIVPALAAATAAATPRKSPGPPLGSAAFEALLDSTTESTARANSSANVLFDGVTSFAERERLITGAQHSICLETFIFSDDQTGEHTADLLIAAVKRGVAVMVMYDGLGSFPTSKQVFDRMRDGGVQVRVYNQASKVPLNEINHRNHAKSLIVDGQAAILGGMNIANEYAYGGTDQPVKDRKPGRQQGWRDVDIEVAGEAVVDAQAHFYADWALVGADVTKDQVAAQTAPPELGALAPAPGQGTSVRVIEHRPQESGDSNTMSAYVAAINSTEHTIDIENAYFEPPEPIRKALEAAAKRGVVVRVRTNSLASVDDSIDVKMAHRSYDELIAAGIQIFEQGTQMLHAKTATFDGSFSLIGSMNLNGRSNGRDSEALVAINSDSVSTQLQTRFGQGLADTTPITAEMMRATPVWNRLQSWSLGALAWTL